MRRDAAVPSLAQGIEWHFFEHCLLEESDEVGPCVDEELDEGAHVGQGEGVVGCLGGAGAAEGGAAVDVLGCVGAADCVHGSGCVAGSGGGDC